MRHLTLLIMLALAGCASGHLRPEAPAPDPALIAQLLATPVPNAKAAKPATFTLVAPHVLLSGNAFRVTCYVPEDYGPGVIRFGLEGVNVRGPKPIETVENSVVIERAECGHWKAVCLVKLANDKVGFLDQDVEVRGGMCEGDGGDR